ncbi:MAG: hypothetical protein AAF215_27155 [Cyanobacteria bacterium P01_A01_bin.123]
MTKLLGLATLNVPLLGGNSFVVTPTSALFIAPNTSNWWYDELAANYDVIHRIPASFQVSDLTSADFVYVGRDCEIADFGIDQAAQDLKLNALKNTEKPLLLQSGPLGQALQFHGSGGPIQAGSMREFQRYEKTHPIFQPWSFASGSLFTYVNGDSSYYLNPGDAGIDSGQFVATNSVQNRIWIGAWVKDQLMAADGGSNFPAPGPRLFMWLREADLANVTPDGMEVWHRCVEWVAGDGTLASVPSVGPSNTVLYLSTAADIAAPGYMRTRLGQLGYTVIDRDYTQFSTVDLSRAGMVLINEQVNSGNFSALFSSSVRGWPGSVFVNEVFVNDELEMVNASSGYNGNSAAQDFYTPDSTHPLVSAVAVSDSDPFQVQTGTENHQYLNAANCGGLGSPFHIVTNQDGTEVRLLYIPAGSALPGGGGDTAAGKRLFWPIKDVTAITPAGATMFDTIIQFLTT